MDKLYIPSVREFSMTPIMLLISTVFVVPLAHADWLPKTIYTVDSIRDKSGNDIFFSSAVAACRAVIEKGNINDPSHVKTFVGLDMSPANAGYPDERTNEGTANCKINERYAGSGEVISTNVQFGYAVLEAPCVGEAESSSGYHSIYKSKLKYCGCDPGYSEKYQKCVAVEDADKVVSEDKNAGGGQSCNLEGNPINPATGGKFMSELDYSSGTGPLKLEFSRTYNNIASASAFKFSGLIASIGRATSIGIGWRHNYEISLEFDNANSTNGAAGVGGVIRVLRANGAMVSFTLQADLSYKGELDSAHTLKALSGGGYLFLNADDNSSETFNAKGQLIKISSRSNWSQTFVYSDVNTPLTIAPVADLLIGIFDESGRQLQLQYDDGRRIVRLIDPAQGIYNYKYDELGNLSSVENPRLELLQYKYNEPEHLVAQNDANGNVVDADLPFSLTGIIDRSGKRYATYTYRADGKAVGSEHAGGNMKVSVVYNDDGSSIVTDALNTARTNTYKTVLGNKLLAGVDQSCSNPTGKIKNYNYDSSGNPVFNLDFNNYRTSYVYDAVRKLETSRTEGMNAGGAVRPESRTISTKWHAVFRLPEIIAEPLKLTTFAYDVNGNLITRTEKATTDLDGSKGISATLDTAVPLRVWKYTYNSVGQNTSIDGPRDDVPDNATIEYYASADSSSPPKWRKGDVKFIKNGLGHATNFNEYDQHGNVIDSTDANGLNVHYQYDELSRVISKNIGGLQTHFTYDPRGMIHTETKPDATVLTYQYDDAHQLETITDNLGNYHQYFYDAIGNRVGEQTYDSAHKLSRSHTRQYNFLNRLEQDVGGENPVSQITRYEYDLGGNQIKTIDPLLRITDQTFDALNRLMDVTQPVPGPGIPRPKTSYTYNGQSQLASVTDPRVLTTSYVTNGLGNRTRLNSPDTGLQNLTHDVAGNIKTSKDGKGQLTSYTYDALNRVVDVLLQDNSSQKYVYDSGPYGKGRLTSIIEKNSNAEVVTILDIGYDIFGRVKKQTRTISGKSFEVLYGYDPVGRLDTLTYPSLRIVKYSYDALGRVSTLSSMGKDVVKDVQYYPFGSVSKFIFGNGQTHNRTQDQDGRTVSYTLGASSYALLYDDASQVKEIQNTTTPLDKSLYTYDGLGHLRTTVLPNANYAYEYDGVGNRTKFTAGGNSKIYSYSASNNRLASVAALTQQFDLNGNLEKSAVGDFTHDAKARLSRHVFNGATNYVVDAQGLRVKKSNGLGDVVYIYDEQGKLISENAMNGTVIKEYIYLGNLPVAVVAQ